MISVDSTRTITGMIKSYALSFIPNLLAQSPLPQQETFHLSAVTRAVKEYLPLPSLNGPQSDSQLTSQTRQYVSTVASSGNTIVNTVKTTRDEAVSQYRSVSYDFSRSSFSAMA